jgi:transcription antitermination protein NusB
MLNRRLLRIKIFQALYSYYQTEPDNVSVALKNLMTSLVKMHELFIRNLLIIVRVADIIDDRFETGKQKYIKSESDSDLLKRLSDNTCIRNLKENAQFQKYVSNYKINLSDDADLLRQIARNTEDSEEYKLYQVSENTKNDMQFLKTIYKNHIYTNHNLHSRLEEMNMHWANDQYYIGIILMTFLKKDSFFSQPEMPIPEAFKPVEFDDAESDEDFVKTLFVKTIKHADEYQTMINSYLENWEPDRIALCDIIIMKMALAEVLNFNQIPIKASLNEYIELTKTFSTPKSKIFVNGILDKVISHYNREGKIEKIGRGLQDN